MGDKLLFREGRTKGLGIVTATGFDKQKFPNATADERDSKEEKAALKAETRTAAAKAEAHARVAAKGKTQ